MSYYGTNMKNNCCGPLFLTFDLFSTKPKWYINNQSRLTSITGVFLTIFVIFLTFLTTINSIIDFLQGKSGNYDYNKIIQNTPLMVPFIQNFDIVVLIDKSNIIDWDSLFGKLDFGFYFGNHLDLKFVLCEKNQYNEYTTMNNSLLCLSSNSKDESMKIKLKPKYLLTEDDFTLANDNKKGVFFRRSSIINKRLNNIKNKSKIRFRENAQLNQLSDEKDINGNRHESKPEHDPNSNSQNCYDINGKPAQQNQRYSECKNPNSDKNRNNNAGQEKSKEEEKTVGKKGEVKESSDDINTKGGDKTNAENTTNSENDIYYPEENKNKGNDNEDTSFDEGLQEIIQEIDITNTFTSPSFYIKPKCFADKKKCNRNSISKYINFVSSVNEMSLLLVSKNSNGYSENIIGKIEMNERPPFEIYLKKKTIVKDLSIFPFFSKKTVKEYFTLEKIKKKETTTYKHNLNSGFSPQPYNFYLTDYSDYIYFKRESIDFLFAKIFGSFYVFYSIGLLMSLLPKAFSQEIFLFNKIGRHIIYDDYFTPFNLAPNTIQAPTIKITKDLSSNMKIPKKEDKIFYYSKGGNNVVTNNSITKTNSCLVNNIENGLNNFTVGKKVQNVKVCPLKTKYYFMKINRKPLNLDLNFCRKVWLSLCHCSNSELSQKERYISLIQSLFEMSTYLSSVLDLIKIKHIILSSKSHDQLNIKHEEIIFNNMLLSQQHIEEEIDGMLSPEKLKLPPSEIIPLTFNSELGSNFLMK